MSLKNAAAIHNFITQFTSSNHDFGILKELYKNTFAIETLTDLNFRVQGYYYPLKFIPSPEKGTGDTLMN